MNLFILIKIIHNTKLVWYLQKKFVTGLIINPVNIKNNIDIFECSHIVFQLI